MEKVWVKPHRYTQGNGTTHSSTQIKMEEDRIEDEVQSLSWLEGWENDLGNYSYLWMCDYKILIRRDQKSHGDLIYILSETEARNKAAVLSGFKYIEGKQK